MEQKPILLDRSYQNEVLSFLLRDYPEYENTDEYCSGLLTTDELKYYANLMYLEMHGLIEDGPKMQYSIGGNAFRLESTTPRITEKGIDFILDDGGLGAILNVQTVKLHQDTIKDLLLLAVQASSADEDKKASFTEQIKSLSSESLKTLLNKLVEKGVDVALNNPSMLLNLLP